ncbi:hypothetical protein [Mycolicibacterium sp. 050158]|uniref:hypothetical protein n=1 Tax=Mycolicibacterium sp. 050158 TaxID=3090602 RepID=UPI00299EC71A|nr:hypothetical protein [Mycolicibacterium sp. 050158]MDX1889350.1 hypothetical protein [Mycolicibacterium sp. 050158]
MSVPPQGNWPPPQQPGNPASSGQPYGPPGNQPGYTASPPGWQQGPWQQPPGPPPQKGNGLKWLLIAVAILLVIGISVGATLIFTRGDGGGGSSPTSGAASDIASANDTGPVSIILDEPTCQSLTAINNSLASAQANGWADQRETLGPVASWTPDQRTQVEDVARAMRSAADRAVPLAKQTPHRVVRELYEQFIAYSRAYADSVSTYSPEDNALATANISASSALVGICNAIEQGATSRALSIGAVPAPSTIAPAGDPANPKRFVTSADSTCSKWVERLNTFNSQTSPDWQNRDSSIPASQWGPERQAIEKAAQPLLSAYASDIEDAGRGSGNPQLEDFANTSALYIRAYLSAEDSYVSSDGWLNYAAFQIANFVSAACTAARS